LIAGIILCGACASSPHYRLNGKIWLSVAAFPRLWQESMNTGMIDFKSMQTPSQRSHINDKAAFHIALHHAVVSWISQSIVHLLKTDRRLF
jgi:hypothetical protein